MLIIYDSKTGNVKRFIEKVSKRNPEFEIVRCTDNPIINEPFVMVTYTTGFGNVPDNTIKFLERNYGYLVGVASSGNRNWKHTFGKSGDTISVQYNVPLISKFELSGTIKDVNEFVDQVNILLDEKAS